jgi:hypothetical protein
MVGVFFSILIVMAVFSIGGEFVMRVRLTRRQSLDDKLAWWRRGGDQVAATYEELFPQSRLPLFRRFVFWLLVACASVFLLAILWKSN